MAHAAAPRPPSLQALYDTMERQARADGLSRDSGGLVVNGPLHQWVQTHCKYRPETEWYLVFELACRLGAQPTP